MQFILLKKTQSILSCRRSGSQVYAQGCDHYFHLHGRLGLGEQLSRQHLLQHVVRTERHDQSQRMDLGQVYLGRAEEGWRFRPQDLPPVRYIVYD